MTRAALVKLLILVILAFIICLPEFFTLYKVSTVSFFCLPYQPCEQGNQVTTGENGKTGDAEKRIKNMCDPSQTPKHEMWETACTQENQSNTTDPASDSRRSGEDPEKIWFMCETDMDVAELHANSSSSALNVHFEASVELQLRDSENLSLTLYGRSNHSSLRLYPPQAEEQEEDKKNDDERQRKAFYCCLPAPPASESANPSRCLLWLANQTVLTATANEKLPWKWTQKGEWRCIFRVIWLALLCVVLLAVVTTVLRQINWGRCLCKKPKAHHVGNNFTGQQFNAGEKHTEIIIPKVMNLHSYESLPWSGLSTIQEVDTKDDIETLLDENVDHCYTANLHYRGHLSTSSVTEEQA